MQLLLCAVFMPDAWAGALASDDDLLSAAATVPGPMAWAGIAPSEVSSSEAADNEAWADCCPSEVSSSEAARSQQNDDDDGAIVPLLPLQERDEFGHGFVEKPITVPRRRFSASGVKRLMKVVCTSVTSSMQHFNWKGSWTAPLALQDADGLSDAEACAFAPAPAAADSIEGAGGKPKFCLRAVEVHPRWRGVGSLHLVSKFGGFSCAMQQLHHITKVVSDSGGGADLISDGNDEWSLDNLLYENIAMIWADSGGFNGEDDTEDSGTVSSVKCCLCHAYEHV